MSCVLVLDTNLIDQRVSFTKSSEQAAYPATNALDINRRRKTWRTAGYWNIESGKNTMVIRDASGGADLTATVAVAEYASDTTFFAALKTALEAVSDSTFTISRDATTNAIKITAVLAGTATAFLIRGAAAGSAQFLPIIGFPLTNQSGALFYVASTLKLHTSEWISFDFGFPVLPTAFLGAADRNRAIRISPTATALLKGSTTDSLAGWAAPQVSVAVSIGDFSIAAVDQAGIGALACRYWRLEIVDTANAFGYIELGALVLATHLVTTRGAVDFPLEADDDDLSLIAESESGQITGSKGPQTQTLGMDWNGLDAASAESIMAVFETYGLHSVFAVVLDGDNAFSTDLLKWALLVRMKDKPRKRLVSPGNWSISWTLREDL